MAGEASIDALFRRSQLITFYESITSEIDLLNKQINDMTMSTSQFSLRHFKDAVINIWKEDFRDVIPHFTGSRQSLVEARNRFDAKTWDISVIACARFDRSCARASWTLVGNIALQKEYTLTFLRPNEWWHGIAPKSLACITYTLNHLFRPLILHIVEWSKKISNVKCFSKTLRTILLY